MTARETTNSVIQKMLTEGDKYFEEPVGVVLLYPQAAFLKAVWTKDTNRDHTSKALIDAAVDELSKA